ncbi:nucleoside hydrolase [Vararia minispora EC-137]|uniref:Nucleoside hydrolase n=1 Tax=Vararia minispora EC-137 TaxID=1314806 RepID=A0ACB8QZX8_9AGAM|nr:nucleoside hydrolase [Vararia minispora EC-137]
MANARKTPVIIDTDPGVDDTVAILMALACPEIEILAFVVTFGNTDLDASYANIFKIYQAVGREIEHDPLAAARFPNYFQAVKPIIVKGPSGPLSGEQHSAKYFHGRDGLGNMSEIHPDLNVPPEVVGAAEHSKLRPLLKPAHEVALDLLRSHAPREVTYIALGPMTNLALMMRTDARCVRERIGRVVAMGGALDVPGNATPVAEFNWYADPYAVSELLHPAPGAAHAGIPLSRTLILPLDITTKHELPFPAYATHIDPTFVPHTPSVPDGKHPLRHFASAFLHRTRDVMRGFGKDALELHDITAVWTAAMVPPTPDKAGEKATKGEYTRGMCVVDRRDEAMAYASGVNRAKLQEDLIKADAAYEGHRFESSAAPAPGHVQDAATSASLLDGYEGVRIVRTTPGPDALLKLLFSRVWGVLI